MRITAVRITRDGGVLPDVAAARYGREMFAEEPSQHVSVVIRRAPAEVYAYAREPLHLPQWAAGLASAQVRLDGDDLFVESPMGDVRVEFVPVNDLGVLDHVVHLPDGEAVLNPLRVVAHPDGAEVIFTVRQLGLSRERFEADVRAVADDLARLRELLQA